MTTFVLKKYVPDTEQKETEPQLDTNPEPEKKLTINVSGSVSEIVARALNRVLPQNVILETKEDEDETDIQAISREDILEKPLDIYRSVKEEGVLFISSEGFKGTRNEEWFLYNVNENKKSKLFYTAESFAQHLVSELMVDDLKSLEIQMQEEADRLLENVSGELTLKEGDLVEIVNDKYCDWAPTEDLKVTEVNEDSFVVEREGQDKWTVSLDEEITFRPTTNSIGESVTIVEGLNSLAMGAFYDRLENEEFKDEFLTIMKNAFLRTSTEDK